MENFNGDPKACNLALYLNQCARQDDSTTENILWIVPHPNFMKNTITFDALNGVIVKFVHHVLRVHITFKLQLQFLDL